MISGEPTNKPRPPVRVYRHKRLARSNAVTIAAGFRFNTGILLCADTQYSGEAKTYETKLFQIRHKDSSLVLAVSGRYLFAKRAVERIEANILAIPEDRLSKGNMQDAIEAALRFVYDNHVYTHPDWGTDDAPLFNFVIGMYSPIDGDFLLATDETLTADMDDRVCLGSGAYLGDYLSRMYTGRYDEMDRVLSLAIYILQQTKSYDQTCGGESEFIVLWDEGGISPMEKLSIAIGERFSQGFPTIIQPLFYALADQKMTDEELQPLLDGVVQSMKQFRQAAQLGGLVEGLRKRLARVRKVTASPSEP